MNIPGGGTVSPPTDIVTSDDFENTTAKAGYWNTTTDASLTSAPSDAYNGSNLKLQWQWNHNPDNRYWSLTDRPGYLRLTTGSIATGILDARNTLTQRTYGPTSSGAVAMDVSQMKDGDVAGLAAFQRKYGYVGVTMSNGTKNIVMQRANSDGTVASTSTPIPLTASTVYLKVDTNYQNFANTASFYYSLDGTSWTKAGDNLAMEYTLPHFMGYRFGLFNYSTAATGGYVDFDYFHVSDQIGQGVATNPCTTTAAILDNGGFEAGTLAPWTGNGTAQLALTTDDKASGTSAVHVTGRTNTGDGPIQSVANELTPGAAYTVSAKVKYTTGPATKQFNVTVIDANYKAYIMALATVTRGQWTTISGSYTVPTSGLDLTTARVFVETVWTGTPDATNDLMDFSADDVSMSGASTAAFDGGLIDNGGFEAGTLAPWTGNGTAQLALTTDDKASGACSVQVTGRTNTGDGPIQSVANELTPGAAYTVSAKVKYTTGPATKQFNVTVIDANYKAYIMALATVTRGQWTTISGSYTVPTSGLDLTTARVFVETVWTGSPDATNDLMDFSVDDVSVSAATTTTHPKGTAKPAKTVGTSNPLMDYQYGADPSAMVYNGRLYVYMTSDGSQIDSNGSINQTYEFDGSGNITNNSYGKIQTITVISSADMVNWTNHGQIKVAGQFGAAKWASSSWAPAATHKVINGKDEFFLYFANSAGGIGVLESESPVGPWRDPIGKALVTGSTPGVAGVVWLFDPAVLTDDDGTSYLYFGGGVPSTGGTSTPAQQDHPQTARVITLGDDMVTTTGTAAMIDAPAMFEDSGINKIGDKYYYSYCTNFSHDNVIDGHTIGYGNIAYMVSDSPMGPFTYQGEILQNPGFFFGDGGNNHHTLFQFNGQWYVTYHAFTLQSALVAGGSLDKNHGYRSTQIDKVTINSDGTIAPITMTHQGISQQSSLDPYQRIEGETIAWDSGIQDAYVPSSGIRVAPLGSDNSDGQKLTNINGGEWTSLAGVDFGSDGAGGATGFAADVLPKAGGQIQIRLDSPDTASDANVVGTLDVPASSAGTWQKISTTLTKKVTGVHDVFFTFKGTGTDELFDVDDWTFTSDAVPTGPVILGVSVAEGAVVSGTKSFEVDLAGAASDVSYTYIELNRDGAWVTDNTTAAALALGSTNAGVKPKLVVDTTTLPNGAYGLKVDAVGTNGKTTEQTINFTVNNAPAKATSSTSAVVVPGKGRSPAKVNVTVSSAAKVTGTVTVTINKGTTKVTDKSASLSKGSVSIRLPKLATGTYTLVVDYKGSNTVAASTTTITYTVS
jgi:arabinoxylan arabinofuranohydrolase